MKSTKRKSTKCHSDAGRLLAHSKSFFKRKLTTQQKELLKQEFLLGQHCGLLLVSPADGDKIHKKCKKKCPCGLGFHEGLLVGIALALAVCPVSHMDEASLRRLVKNA